MPLTESEVRSIAEYVRIGLTDAEISAMTDDMNATLELIDPITKYDLEGVEPTFHPIGKMRNVMREDVLGSCFENDIALSNSASVEDGCFDIPSILGKEGAC